MRPGPCCLLHMHLQGIRILGVPVDDESQQPGRALAELASGPGVLVTPTAPLGYIPFAACPQGGWREGFLESFEKVNTLCRVSASRDHPPKRWFTSRLYATVLNLTRLCTTSYFNLAHALLALQSSARDLPQVTQTDYLDGRGSASIGSGDDERLWIMLDWQQHQTLST